jgi:ssDNA-binding replication factor A large subunit
MAVVNLKGKGLTRERRVIAIRDETARITVTLWSQNAAIQYYEGMVIAIKGAKVSDFMGKSINCGDVAIYLEP